MTTGPSMTGEPGPARAARVLPAAATGAVATSPAADGLRDIHPPVPLTDPWVVAGWVAAALAVAGLGAAVAWWWVRRSRAGHPAAVPDAADVARKRLADALGLVGEPRAFVEAVSGAVREFLEARLGLHAPDRTTEEFLAELAGEGRMDPADRGLLAGFLERCDLVKFAGDRPGRADLEDLHGAALRLVNAIPAVAALPAGGPGEGTP